MVTYIIISLIILAATAVLVRKQRMNLKRQTISLTAGISLTVSVLVFPFFYSKLGDAVVSGLKSLRYGFIEMLSMNVEPDVIDVLDPPGILRPLYIVLLYILYAAGPLSASLFAASFSRSFTEWFSMLTHRKIHVFSELNPATVTIAESLSSSRPKELLVFCNDSDDSDADLVLRAKRAGAVFTRKNECDLRHSTRKEYEFYEIADDISRTLAGTADLCRALVRKKNYIPSRTIVRYSVSGDHLELARNLDSSFGSTVRLRPVSIDDSTALSMFRRYSDILTSPGRHEIVIVGGDRLGSSVLNMAVCLLIQPDSPFTVHCLSGNARQEASRLKAVSPGILNLPIERYFSSDPEGKNYDIRFYETDLRGSGPLEILSMISSPDLVCVCGTDDNLNYSLALRIKRLYASGNADLSFPAVSCCVRDGALNEILIPENGIDLFGNEADCYSYDSVIDPELEDEARRVHLSYLSSSEPDVLKQPSYIQEQVLTDTGFYNYVNLQSSLYCALSLEFRRAYILRQKPAGYTGDDDSFLREWLSDPGNLDSLGESEHLRWNAYQRFQGWRPASAAQTESIARSSAGRSVKSDELLLHPALVPTEELAVVTEATDRIRQSVAPGSGRIRFTESDKDILIRIPDILGN